MNPWADDWLLRPLRKATEAPQSNRLRRDQLVQRGKGENVVSRLTHFTAMEWIKRGSGVTHLT